MSVENGGLAVRGRAGILEVIWIVVRRLVIGRAAGKNIVDSCRQQAKNNLLDHTAADLVYEDVWGNSAGGRERGIR